MHGGGWYSYLRSGDDKPQKVTRELLLRVLTYARPYWNHIGGMLVTILFTHGTLAGLAADLPAIDRQDPAIQRLERTDALRAGAVARPARQRRDQRDPAAAECRRGRRRDLRSARGALRRACSACRCASSPTPRSAS